MGKSTITSNSKRALENAEVNQTEASILEHDVQDAKVFGRKKLKAKRTIQHGQEKIKKEIETPQMRELREKIAKRKEKNVKSSKTIKVISKLPSLQCDNVDTSTNKSIKIKSQKTKSTSEMQVLLKKTQEKNSKQLESNQQPLSKGNNVIRTCVRRQTMGKQKNTTEPVSDLANKSNVRSQNKQKVEKLQQISGRKRVNKKCNSCEGTPTKRRQEPLKKNVAQVRMNQLRESLTSTYKHNSSVDNDDPGDTVFNVEVKLPNNAIDVRESSVMPTSSRTSFYEEMDWEPLEDEQITHEVQAVRMQLCTENPTHTSCEIPVNNLTKDKLLKQEKRQLCIVVDTNVFLSNIGGIELAREFNFKTYDRPLIFIPWTVIRELDYIKDNRNGKRSTLLCEKARKAINYINKLLDSMQPRIIGQTLEDVIQNKKRFSSECPDDEILQTCLQLRDLGKSVVLLSYDVNLCNKAMIYDIVTLGRTDPLEKADYLNASTSMYDKLFKSEVMDREKSSLGSSLIMNEEESFADEIFEDVKCILRDFLTMVVSKEMQELYGDCWEKYVSSKPPWTVVAVLQCATKHWIAAVSESFERRAESILKELLQIFRSSTGRSTLQENVYILQKCTDLIQMLKKSKYEHLISRVSKKINELTEKCSRYQFRLNEERLEKTGESLKQMIKGEVNVAGEEQRAQRAFRYFEAAYVFARDICGLAAKAVGMPCSFQYNVPNPTPSLHYVKNIQVQLAVDVNKLLHCLSATMEQVKSFNIDQETMKNLYQTLKTFLPNDTRIAAGLSNVDLEPFDIYCCIKLKEDVLKRGLNQLQELSTHFCKMATYRCT